MKKLLFLLLFIPVLIAGQNYVSFEFSDSTVYTSDAVGTGGSPVVALYSYTAIKTATLSFKVSPLGTSPTNLTDTSGTVINFTFADSTTVFLPEEISNALRGTIQLVSDSLETSLPTIYGILGRN